MSKIFEYSSKDKTKSPFDGFPSNNFNVISDCMESLLKDGSFFLAFRKVIEENLALFKNAIVLDINCGCGILSMMASQAGAAHVIGIEKSTLVNDAKKIAHTNNLNQIIFIKGKVQEIELPNGLDKVDIIISRWMENNLFHDCSLNDVIYARDKWLRPNGLIFPDRCCLYVCGIENKSYMENTVNWYTKDVFGFDFSNLREECLSEPNVNGIDGDRVITTPNLLVEIDMYTYKKQKLSINAEFQLICLKNDYIHGLATYFSVEFSKARNKVGMNTSPLSEITHWKQTVFYFKKQLIVKKDEVISGVIDLKSESEEYKKLNIDIKFKFKGELCESEEKNKYRMT